MHHTVNPSPTQHALEAHCCICGRCPVLHLAEKREEPEHPYGSGPELCELPRTPYSGSPTSENLPSRYFVNKPPADVPETAGWHHNHAGPRLHRPQLAAWPRLKPGGI